MSLALISSSTPFQVTSEHSHATALALQRLLLEKHLTLFPDILLGSGLLESDLGNSSLDVSSADKPISACTFLVALLCLSRLLFLELFPFLSLESECFLLGDDFFLHLLPEGLLFLSLLPVRLPPPYLPPSQFRDMALVAEAFLLQILPECDMTLQ